MKQSDRIIKRTIDIQRELTREGLTRRNLLRLGVLGAGSGMLLPIQGLSMRAAFAKGSDELSCPVPGVGIISPQVCVPWKHELRRLVEKQPIDVDKISWGNGGGAPGPDPIGTLTGGDSKVRLLKDFSHLKNATPYENLSHQGWGKGGALGGFAPKKYYEMRMVQGKWNWHDDLTHFRGDGNLAWAFDGVFPGPMFRVRYGEPYFVRIHNDLPPGPSQLGFGNPIISTHLHNMHSPSESDGGPLYYNYPGHYWDYHYPMVYAGVNQYGGIGDPREALGTLFYHDHKLDFTSQNVYAGVLGMCSVYDDLDSGDPTESTGLRLPCGEDFEYDVGLAIHDRQFDPEGTDFFPLTCFDGALGDMPTVNGTIWPRMTVKRRRYRFRLLNMGPSRFLWYFLRVGDASDNPTYLPLDIIANDGNLLPRAVRVQSMKSAVAERFDVVVDFSQFAPGTELYLVNRAEQTNGRGPTGALLPHRQAIEMMKIVVSDEMPADNSLPVYPGRPLRALPDTSQAISRTKLWRWDRANGEWAVNGEIFDRFSKPYEIPEGTAEKWTIMNGGGSWSHPVHIHYEEHRQLTYNGQRPTPLEASRKDVIRLDPNAEVNIYMRFRDYKGIYPMHCHNVLHEDHAMMAMWKIV